MKMKRVSLAALFAATAALPALAEMELTDTGGDNMASFEEDAQRIAAMDSGDLEPLGD